MTTYKNTNKQWILTVTFALSMLLCQTASAFSWKDLWSRPDEQGAKLLQQGKPKQAAKTFENSNWRGVANYRSGEYEKAITDFSQQKTATSLYNKGNAMAHKGQYRAAIESYDESLKLNPNNKDAIYNRDLLKKLLKKKQKQQQQSRNKNKQNKDKQQSKSNQSKQQASKSQQKQQRQQQKQQQQSAQQKQSSKQQQAGGQKNQQPKQSDKQGQQQQQAQQQPDKTPSSPKQQAQNKQQLEKQQAQKQWLRRVPDDPGGLLKQKFLRDYMRMQNNQYKQ